jgi:carbon storage regulator
MIVFSRQVDEGFVIGDDIIVTVVEIRDGKVRIGIEAPKEVPVHRREVFEAIQQACDSHQEDPPQGRWRLLRRFFGG